MRTHEFRALLRKRFCPPEWALMEEVGQGTGGRGGRYADAIAFNLWPSRGLAIHGFEIKVSRQDLLRELADPAKAEPIARYCDFWWLVTPKGLVKDGELPINWGLYEDSGSEKRPGLISKKAANKNVDVRPLDRTFAAAMMRRTTEVDQAVINKLVEDRVKVVREGVREEIDRAVKRRTQELESFRKIVEDIEEVTGHPVHAWTNGKDIGRAVRAVLDMGILHEWNGLLSLADSLEKTAGKIRQHMPSSAPTTADALEEVTIQ